ncbi:MAG: hypothetical protein K9W46_07010 [Candidatus Heimdallarchaeum endolithica]|uniref:Uncharacterized protein n=1 Tax=Candidatus Heimdallarchaeum endolithica TaxID=2876572 RepID=A0A9Y1FRN2_9ARCH|nr:MAG: hypothetical protein K9W46_07010 [Candidatus Heimdallarchaeum endolithica]
MSETDVKQKEEVEEVEEVEESFTKFSVILGRDLIFLDWTVNFGGQILGLVVGLLLGVIFGAKMGTLFNIDVPVDISAYIALQVGILLSITSLTIYYLSKLGIKVNSPKSIASKKLLLLKTIMFAFSAIFALSYLFNSHIFPFIYANYSSIKPPEPGQTGTGDGGEGNTVDIPTTNHYIVLIALIVLVAASYALLYAGLFYSFNKKANTMTGVAIMVSTIMAALTLLSQNQSVQKLIDGEIMAFLTDFAYFFLVALIAILSYHMCKRIELSLIIMYIGFIFGFGAPSNAVSQIIALKWGFPNFSDGINSTSDVITRTLELIEYVSLFGIVVYPLIFYKDTISALKELKKMYRLPFLLIKFLGLIIITPFKIIFKPKILVHFYNGVKQIVIDEEKRNISFKKLKTKLSEEFKAITSSEGFSVTLFAAVLILIEVTILFLANLLGIFLYFIAFLILIGIVNSIITSKYGAASYTAMFSALTESSLSVSPLVPDINVQIKFLEYKKKQLEKTKISVGTLIPVFAYYIIAYITTAITKDTSLLTILFLMILVPISLALASFSISFFYVKKPLIKEIYTYPLRFFYFLGLIVYFSISVYRLIYNQIGLFPAFSLLYLVLIYITFSKRSKLSELILFLGTEKRDRAFNELICKKNLNIDVLLQNLDDTPSYLSFWISAILIKRNKKEVITYLKDLLKQDYKYQRVIGALSLLYLNEYDFLEELVNLLENDPDPYLREAIAYGLRYCKDMKIDIYKRIIDAQHYEDNSKVLVRLKETISILDRYFANKERKEEEMEELVEVI